MKKKHVQPGPKPFIGWGLYNWGHPWGVFTTRRAAFKEAMDQTGNPWSVCRQNFRVAKVRVTLNGDAR